MSKKGMQSKLFFISMKKKGLVCSVRILFSCLHNLMREPVLPLAGVLNWRAVTLCLGLGLSVYVSSSCNRDWFRCERSSLKCILLILPLSIISLCRCRHANPKIRKKYNELHFLSPLSWWKWDQIAKRAHMLSLLCKRFVWKKKKLN